MKRFNLSLLTIITFSLFMWTQPAIAEEHDHHEVVIGLTDISGGGQQITIVEDHALSMELKYNTLMGIYYGGQACWIPADGDLHLMEPYGNGTPPAGHYELELVAVNMPASVIAFDSESFSQILNSSPYALNEWHWEEMEGWHFHNHISWGLDSSLVTPGQTVIASFKLIDSTGQYADSQVFDVSITAVPEPATLGLLAMGTTMLRQRNPKKA